MQEELTRLESFAATHRNKRYDEEDISKYEWQSLWEYYDALNDAISYAVQSNVTFSDDVWTRLDDDWWVKDGSIAASDYDEHCVKPILSVPTTDEL